MDQFSGKSGYKNKMKKIKINFSNKWLYILIGVIIFTLFCAGVYAFGTSNPEVFGHNINEVGFPTNCQIGQFLKWEGSSWVCSDFS